MKLHTYKPPLATRITLTVLLVTLMLFLCGIAFLLSNEITTPSEQGYLSYFNLAVFLVLTSFGFFILKFNSQKVTIDKNTLHYSSFMKKRFIPLEDMKGFRKGTRIKFIPKKNTGHRRISAFTQKRLQDWANTNLIDLDISDYQEEEAQILKDPIIGVTAAERHTKLDGARLIGNGISAVGGILLVLTVFFKIPIWCYGAFVIMAFTIILFSLIYFNGLVRMEWRTARASMWVPIILIMFLTGFMLMDLGSVESFPLSVLALILTVIMSLVYVFILVGKKNYNFKRIWMSFLLFFLFIYPAIRVFNVLFDFSKPITYQTEVIEINREVGWRGFVSYEMHLKLWSEEGGVFNEVRVAQETYENVAPGSLVEIKESNGALGAKWFTVHLDGKELNDSDLNFF